MKYLGVQDYESVFSAQQQFTRNRSEQDPDELWVVAHPPVFTLGQAGKTEHVLDAGLIPLVRSDRGGQVTYHGPGQLVMYPILDLEQFFTDIHQYLRFLEEAVIETLHHFGIAATRFEGLTGVWLDADGPHPRKICAMGVKCSRWITMHGIALNVHPDLSYFGNIVPCGIQDKAVTSMVAELGNPVDFAEVRAVLTQKMATLFKFQISQ